MAPTQEQGMHDTQFPVGYRRCPKCGAASFGRITYCLLCHAPLPFEPLESRKEPATNSDAPRVQFCNRCGKPVPQDLEDVRFCRHCGNRLPV